MSVWSSIAEAIFTPYDFAERRKREGPRKFAIDRAEFDENRSDTEMVAKYIHDRYEHHANKCGWATNKLCRVSFEALPSSNRRTMMAVAADLMKYLEGHNGTSAL